MALEDSVIVLAGGELDLTEGSAWNGSYHVSKIYVDGLVGSFCAQSIGTTALPSDLAVLGVYGANDVSCISATKTYTEGRFNKVYNATGGANLRCVIERS